MTTRRRGFAISVLAALAATLVAPAPASADERAAALFQGKQMRFNTMGSPGGGYDTYMRALVPLLERSSARRCCRPRVGRGRADRHEPHAHRGAGRTDHSAGRRRDAGHAHLRLPGRQLRRAQSHLARAREQRGEGGAARPGRPVHRRGPDESDQPVLWAGAGKIDGNADFAAIMAYALGMQRKIIIGYKGTGDMNLAIRAARSTAAWCRRNPLRCMGRATACGSWSRSRASGSSSSRDAPTSSRRRARPGAGAPARLARRHRRLGRLMLVTPGTPAERVDLLRRCWRRCIRDPAFHRRGEELQPLGQPRRRRGGARGGRAGHGDARQVRPGRGAQHRARVAIISIRRAASVRRGKCSASSIISPLPATITRCSACSTARFSA